MEKTGYSDTLTIKYKNVKREEKDNDG